MCRNKEKRKALPGDSKAKATATVRALLENSLFFLLLLTCLLSFLFVLSSLYFLFFSVFFLLSLFFLYRLFSVFFCILCLNSETKPKLGLDLCFLPFVPSAPGFFLLPFSVSPLFLSSSSVLPFFLFSLDILLLLLPVVLSRSLAFIAKENNAVSSNHKV